MNSSEDIRAALVALATDIVCVLVFCTLGRRTHAEGLDPSGIAQTAWPFLVGTAVGWLLSRGWRNPAAVVPTGVVVWACTVAVGMILRHVTDAGLAPSFIVVASLSTGLLLVGWRVGVRLMTRG